MSRVVTFDFSDAPPSQGGGSFAHIPPGPYIGRLKVVNEAKSKAQNKMYVVDWEVASGTAAGTEFRDHFVWEGSKVGQQRFHAMLLAMGAKIPAGPFPLDLDALAGKLCVLQIKDETMEVTDTYSARVVSKIAAYYPMNTVPGAAPAATAPVAEVAPPAPSPVAPAPVVVPQPAPVVAPPPPPVPPVVAPAPEFAAVAAAPAAPVAAPVAPEATFAQLATEVDDLFS